MRTMSRPAVALRGACAMFVLGGFAETALADPTESVAPPARGPSMAVPAGSPFAMKVYEPSQDEVKAGLLFYNALS